MSFFFSRFWIVRQPLKVIKIIITIWINKEQYFDGFSKEIWEYKIGAYPVMDKYLENRKKDKRKLPLEEIEHCMGVAKTIERTRVVQGEVEEAMRLDGEDL